MIFTKQRDQSNATLKLQYPLLTCWFINVQKHVKNLNSATKMLMSLPVISDAFTFFYALFGSQRVTRQKTSPLLWLVYTSNISNVFTIKYSRWLVSSSELINKLFNNIYINYIYKFNKIHEGLVTSKIKVIKKLDYNHSRYSFVLNFKKQRFFPCMYNVLYKKTLFNSSLGIFSKKFSNKKSFLRSKNSYIMSATFLRRMLIYLRLPHIILKVIKTPKFLKDIIFIMLSNSNALYTHPYSHNLITEKHIITNFFFDLVIFTNNKCYGPVKKKKRGRVKRKITKKLFLYNNILD